MERKTAGSNFRICVVCNKNIKQDEFKALKVDGLWVCGSDCLGKFQKEKEKWAPEQWTQLCKMQALYESRKREEINTAMKEPNKINR